MTWEEWVHTSYNISGFDILNTNLRTELCYYVDGVFYNDIFYENDYYIKPGSCGGGSN